MSAASFETSVPVIPIAIPMSAFFSAGASLTPSPVIAMISPCRRSASTRRTLFSGVTRARTPISPICASTCSSLISSNSAPVIARPSIPSSRAIAAAVTAWSPVIIRTFIPAAVAVAIATLAVGRGGSTMPVSESAVSSCISSSRSPLALNDSGWKSRRAVARTRRPCSPRRSFSARYRSRRSSFSSTGFRSASSTLVARASTWSGAPLTKQRTMSRPDSSCTRWKEAISLYSESNGSSARRGKFLLVSSESKPPFSARTTSAPSVGSPIISPSFTTASEARIIGIMNWSSGTSLVPAERRIVPSVE